MTELSKFPFDGLPRLDERDSTRDQRSQKLTDRTLAFFTGSRDYLSSLPVRSCWGDLRELEVDFRGDIVDWRVDDPDDLRQNPDKLGCWEERMSVRSPDWTYDASLELLVNRFPVGSINLDQGTASDSVWGYVGADIRLSATDIKEQDSLTADYSMLTGGWHTSKLANGAPGREEALSANPAHREKIDLSTDESSYQQLMVAAVKLSELLERIRDKRL